MFHTVTSSFTILTAGGLRYDYPATSFEVFLLFIGIALWAAIIIFIANQTSKREALTRPQKVTWVLGAIILPPIAIVLYFIVRPGRS